MLHVIFEDVASFDGPRVLDASDYEHPNGTIRLIQEDVEVTIEGNEGYRSNSTKKSVEYEQ